VDKKQYAGEETKEFMRQADKYDVEFPIPPQENTMKDKVIKYIALGLLAFALLLFTQQARASDDTCWYTEGVPCKESL